MECTGNRSCFHRYCRRGCDHLYHRPREAGEGYRSLAILCQQALAVGAVSHLSPDIPLYDHPASDQESDFRNAPSVLLISMPWAPILEPSLGLAILKTRLQDQGISCRVIHLNLQLLKFLKPDSYDKLAEIYALNDF